MTEETKQLLIGQIEAYFEDFEATVRFLNHQLQQPSNFRVFDGSEEDLLDQLKVATSQRDLYFKVLEELQPSKPVLPPWQNSKQENS